MPIVWLQAFDAAALNPAQVLRLSGFAPSPLDVFGGAHIHFLEMRDGQDRCGDRCAGAGVGRATVEAFAKGRLRCRAAVARSGPAEQGRGRPAAITAGATLAIPTDVADADAVEAAAEKVETELGPIDVWVNVAMATVFAPVQ